MIRNIFESSDISIDEYLPKWEGIADQVNAANGLRPGANISPETIARFSEGAE